VSDLWEVFADLIHTFLCSASGPWRDCPDGREHDWFAEMAVTDERVKELLRHD
jgi:hypothetical protein